MCLFDTAFNEVIQAEGGLSMDPNDRGNWTSGRINVGELKGTKYGISAMSYPYLDIHNLTMRAAQEIYRKDFWEYLDLHTISKKFPRVARMMFSLGINCGNRNAVKFLQRTINVLNFQENLKIPAMRGSHWQEKILRHLGGKPLKVDGLMGARTMEALLLIPHPDAVAAGVFGEAYKHYAKGKLIYRAGWLNRLGISYLN